jgi:hypothetical protein
LQTCLIGQKVADAAFHAVFFDNQNTLRIKMEQLKPPTPLPAKRDKVAIFMAGSIEQGTAEDWQVKVAEALADYNVLLYNPRRDKWDASLEQSIDNEVFRAQVEWELDALDDADWIIMYFDPATKSPITLLEFGLWLNSGKLIVCCPDGFWRKGNLQVCCARAGIKLHESLDELIEVTKNMLQVQ